jgi:hypothetical protein
MIKILLQTDSDYVYAFLRIVAGIIVFPYGMQKLFGWFGAPGFGAPGAARLLGSGNPSEYLPLSILLTELVNGRDKANSPFSYLSKRMERNTGFGLVSERLPTHARTCTTSLHKETCSYCPPLFPPLQR